MNSLPKFLDENIAKNLIELARKAGDAILEIYNSDDFGVKLKKDDSPLTRADLASQSVILEGLKKLTPKIPVIDEETALPPYEERKKWDFFWIVDPVDGTKEFVNRNGEFTVNISLIGNNIPLLGVIHAPALDLTYYGELGTAPVKIKGVGYPEEISTSAFEESRKLKSVVSRSHCDKETNDFIKQLGDMELVSSGSALKLCRVAEGSADVYPRLGTQHEWDIAAGQVILESAGGIMTDKQGSPIKYNKPDARQDGFIAFGNSRVAEFVRNKIGDW